MSTRRASAAILALATAAPVAAAGARLLAALSESRIDISTRFAGADLLVFGAIQYPGGRAPVRRPDLAVVLRGPDEAITVRRKARVAGIWINADAVRFDTAPVYYAIATTRPAAGMVRDRGAAKYQIGLDRLKLGASGAGSPAELADFTRGFVRLRERAGLYVEQPTGIRVDDNVLYQARLPMPSQVPTGRYEAQIYFIRDGRVLARAVKPIMVDKSGFERETWLFAHRSSVLYGLSAIGIAVFAGWAASFLGRRGGG